MEIHSVTLAFLVAVAALAGFVDAIAGGGGLLTLPALLQLDMPMLATLGTNKGQSVFGSAMALLRYWHSPLLDRRRALASVAPGFLGAVVGVALVSLISPERLKPLVVVLLVCVAVPLMVRRPKSAIGPPRVRGLGMILGVALLMGAYDGFFGPGVGMLLVITYNALWHDSLDAASANAKAVNFASNLGSMVYFAAAGHVVWSIALPMAAGQAIGGWCGAHTTIRAGQGLVRAAVLLLCLALVGRVVWAAMY